MSDHRHFLTSLLTNGASEIIQKISRIAVVVVVARVMDAEAIGLAAAAIAAGDILKSLTETGVVQRIIAARDAALPGVVTTARRLFWLWCAGLFAVQCLLAAGICDKLVIGATLGAEALGIYFFAFNAGLSLATSISTAFSRVIFPKITAATNRARATGEAVWLGLLLTTPIVLLQAFAAPYYVPLLLGEEWAYIAPIVSILCLAAIPTMVWSGTAQWLRAEDRALTELAVTSVLTIALLTATYLLSPLGLEAIAWGYLAISCAVQLFASIPLFLSIRQLEA